jgi:hypothetical protein
VEVLAGLESLGTRGKGMIEWTERDTWNLQFVKEYPYREDGIFKPRPPKSMDESLRMHDKCMSNAVASIQHDQDLLFALYLALKKPGRVLQITDWADYECGQRVHWADVLIKVPWGLFRRWRRRWVFTMETKAAWQENERGEGVAADIVDWRIYNFWHTASPDNGLLPTLVVPECQLTPDCIVFYTKRYIQELYPSAEFSVEWVDK